MSGLYIPRGFETRGQQFHAPHIGFDTQEVIKTAQAIKTRFALDALYKEANPAKATAARKHAERIESEISTIQRKTSGLMQFIFRRNKTKGPSFAGLNIENVGRIGQTLELAELTDLNKHEFVHIHDFCAGIGTNLNIIAMHRYFEHMTTNGTSWDMDPRALNASRVIKKRTPWGKRVQTKESTIADAKIDRDPSLATFWLSRFPEAIEDILKKASQAKEEDCPTGIGILPCKCHCFDTDKRPDTDALSETITTREWQLLSKAASKTKRQSQPEVAAVIELARETINGIRAQQLNASNKQLRAEVHRTSYGSNVLIAMKKIKSN